MSDQTTIAPDAIVWHDLHDRSRTFWEGFLGDFAGGDGVRFTLMHRPTCYRRGPYCLNIEIALGEHHHAWGCFDEQDQPTRYYHELESVFRESAAIAKVLWKDRSDRKRLAAGVALGAKVGEALGGTEGAAAAGALLGALVAASSITPRVQRGGYAVGPQCKRSCDQAPNCPCYGLESPTPSYVVGLRVRALRQVNMACVPGDMGTVLEVNPRAGSAGTLRVEFDGHKFERSHDATIIIGDGEVEPVSEPVSDPVEPDRIFQTEPAEPVKHGRYIPSRDPGCSMALVVYMAAGHDETEDGHPMVEILASFGCGLEYALDGDRGAVLQDITETIRERQTGFYVEVGTTKDEQYGMDGLYVIEARWIGGGGEYTDDAEFVIQEVRDLTGAERVCISASGGLDTVAHLWSDAWADVACRECSKPLSEHDRGTFKCPAGGTP